jgi:hypothetical protein
MTVCLQCKSQRVIRGKIVDFENEGAAVFRPDGLRTFALTLAPGPFLESRGFACLDCGLVWGATSPKKLATFIRKHCKESVDNNEDV